MFKQSVTRRMEAALRGGLTRSTPKRVRLGALAVGAMACGALAIGALALGRVAIGRLFVGRARIKRLEIDELVVAKISAEDRLQPGAELRQAG